MEKNVYQILQEWHELFKNGVITDKEFAAKKRELLGNEEEREKPIIKEENSPIINKEAEKTTDTEYEELFNKKSWFQRNKWYALLIAILFLGSLIFLFFFNSKNSTQDEIKSLYTNSPLYKIDSTIRNVLIGNDLFTILVLRDKFDEHNKKFIDGTDTASEGYSIEQSPITLMILRNDNKVVYKKKLTIYHVTTDPDDYPFIIYRFFKGQNQDLDKSGKLYFLLNTSYGGSGSTSNYYSIDLNENKITMSQIFKSTAELDYIVYNKNDQEIYLFGGIWDGSDDGHFGNHRYEIKKFNFKDGIFLETKIGKTKLKYSSLDTADPFKEIIIAIKTKEPSLLESFNPSDFISSN